MILKIPTGFYHQPNLINLSKLKERIKKNEGFRNRAYKDQLGNYTIGYGHLIKASDKIVLKKKYSKPLLNKLFEKDFNKAMLDYKKHYSKKNLSDFSREVLIEMIFQMGIKNVLKFKKFNKSLLQKKFYLSALEMLDSLWYSQTPKRVDLHIRTLLRN